jgi:sulfonate transport system ATP-binding protein
VAAALCRSGLPAAERRQGVAEHLALVGLADFARAWPAQLSNGTAQREAIARALVNRPRILPLGGHLVRWMRSPARACRTNLRGFVRHENTTALPVTHDVDEAVFWPGIAPR